MRGLVVRVGLALLAAGCLAPVPRRIAYGQESCAYCRMTVGDPRFGSELVTRKGRVYTFDAVECMASYYLSNRAVAGSLWVPDPSRSGALQPAESARYETGSGGEGAGGSMGTGVRPVLGGGLGWSDVLALVEGERDRRAPADPAAR